MLKVEELVYRKGNRTLFTNANLVVPTGAKVGLVGRNGSGKTTLFQLIIQELEPETGSIVISKNTRIGYVQQEAPDTSQSLIEFVLAADQERSHLMEQVESETDAGKLSEIHARLTDIDSYSAEARAATVLHGLGFGNEIQCDSVANLSGGWRMRVALAAVLFTQPDLLLLDEPTNYLDLEGTVWLQNYLKKYTKSILLISHDTGLLNQSVNTIAHLHECRFKTYKGGYSDFKRQRNLQLLVEQKQKSKQEANRRHLEAFVDRFRAKASKARQAQSRIKMLEKLDPISATVENEVRPITLPTPKQRAAPPLVVMENVSVGYDGKPVLEELNLRIDPDDRIALLGSNGNGKSTFAKLISGKLPAMHGKVVMARKMTAGYFAQHQLDELIPSHTPVDHVRDHMRNDQESAVRARVAQFGLPTDRMNLQADKLSGGEKARLLLGLATMTAPNLIILDEPTNHLDIDSREALLHAINEFNGAVILISHDQLLIESCAEQLWLVNDGRVTDFDGDLNDYRQFLLQSKPLKNELKSPGTGNTRSELKFRRKKSADLRNKIAPLKRKIHATEQSIESLQRRLTEIDLALSTADIYQDNPQMANSYTKERKEVKEKLDGFESQWLSLSSELEKLGLETEESTCD